MGPSPEPFSFDGAGVRLAGDRWEGNATGRPVVILLHGGGQTRHSWGRSAERLAGKGWTTVALDARGHGDSEWAADGDYRIDGFANDLLAFIATLDQPPVLVGASLGGMTALTVAGEHPGSASGLVLVDVVVEIRPEGVARIHAFMTAHPDGFESLEEVADAIAAYNPLRPRPKKLDGLRKNVRQGEDGRWRWHWDPAVVAIGDEPQRRTSPERLGAAAANVTIPTLIVRGSQSDVVAPAGVEDMLRRIPHAEAIDVLQAGHMVAGDDNDVFGAALEKFLQQLG